MYQFLAELIVRIFGKTPKFFKTLQLITIVIAIITGLPTFLAEAGVELPEAWNNVVLKIISISSMVSSVIAQLTLTTDDKVIEGIKD